MELKPLDRGSLKLWLVRNLIIAAIILAAAIVVIALCADEYRVAVLFSVGIPSVFSIALLLLYPYFKYKFYRYGYDDRKITVCRGVIFRKRIIIPICQIQDLHRFEGPLMMIFKMSGVEISTAGSNFTLACLETANADKMISELENFLESRAEEIKNEEIS